MLYPMKISKEVKRQGTRRSEKAEEGECPKEGKQNWHYIWAYTASGKAAWTYTLTFAPYCNITEMIVKEYFLKT